MENLVQNVIGVALLVLAICICFALYRAVKGPRFTDRMVAINMIGTMTTVMICLASVYLDEPTLIDVALIYTLLSFLAVVVICYVVKLHHMGRELHLKRLQEEEKE